MKLLIVDDNVKIRKIIKEICFSLFDELTECSDGSEAVQVYKSLKPDWVIMDIKMKKMDGLAASRLITGEYNAAKIIVISQYTDEQIIEAARSAGAKKFVSKENLLKIKEIITTNNK